MKKDIVYNQDNLTLMDSLPEKSINLIYVDPPFNTKRGDLGYDDSFESTEGFVYWLQFRIAKMYRLLKDTGVICVHLDHRTVHYIKVAMDRIFGEKNLINEIVWNRTTGTATEPTRMFSNVVDYILCFKKGNNGTFNKVCIPQSKEYLKSFKYKDDDGRFYTKASMSSGLGKGSFYSYKGYSPPKNGWSISLKKMIELDKKGLVYFPKDKSKVLRKKQYLDESMLKSVSNLWTDIPPLSSQAKERTGYKTQKPLKLLQRFIKTFTNDGDLVADFFCGSGTTLVAAKQLGRQYLGCDVSKKAVKITKERLNNARDQNSSPTGSR